MTGIKISYAHQTKRISESINTYENLIQIVKKLFSLDQLSLLNDNPNQFHLYYIDKDQEKIEVASQEDYIEVCKYHKQSRETSVMKLELFVNNFKDSIFIDQMLDDVKMSESFAVIDKRDILQSSQYLNQDDMKSVNDTRLINTDFDLQASAISKDLEKSVKELVSDVNEQRQSHEKGVQLENFCVVESNFTETEKSMTVEVAEKTNALEKKDGSAKHDVKEKNCEANKKFDKANFYRSNEEDIININDDKDKIIYETTRDKIQENMTYQSMNLSEKGFSNESIENQLVSRIDQIITSRLSLLESNFKKYIESNQMNSKLYQPIENVNHGELTHEQEKSEQKEINKLLKLEDNDAVLKEMLNCNLVEEVEEKIEIDPKISDLSEDKRPVFSSLAEPNDNLLSNNNFHFNDYCSNCKFQILKNKYVCLICDNFHLCSQCESIHLDHPLMKVNINNKIITTRKELEFYFRRQRKESKNVDKKGGLFKKFGKMFKPTECGINILPKSSTIFAMGKSSKLTYTLAVSSGTKISEEIVVYPVNNKNVQVAPVYLNGLEANESREVEITIIAPNKVGVYSFEISANIKNKKMNFSPMKLEIIVSESEDVDEANANLMFHQHDEILKLPKDKKITLYNLITGQIVKKDFRDVLIIMRKHNYEIDEALNDLIEDENSRIVDKNSNPYYQYSDLQYY